jgi:hypothetical protein
MRKSDAEQRLPKPSREPIVKVVPKPRRGRPPKGPRPKRWKRTMTPASIAANRVRRWKHGESAQSVTAMEVIEHRIEMLLGPEGAELYRKYLASITQGDLSQTDEVSVRALAELEFVRRAAIRDIQKRGVAIVEKVITSDGRTLGKRVRPHPLLMPLVEIYATLGHDAKSLLLDKRERGATVLSLELARRVRRSRMLRGAEKSNMPPPKDRETVTEEEQLAEGQRLLARRQEQQERRTAGEKLAEDLTPEEEDAVVEMLESGDIKK